MTYGITPIAVSVEQVQSVIDSDQTPSFLRRLLGSPTDRLIHTLKRKFAHRFEQDDVLDDDEPTLEQAIADLLAGNELSKSYGHKYAYAFELLCDHFGEFLDNSAWSAMRVEWAEQVHEAMKQAGIDEQALSFTNHLMYRGAPISIPTPSDFPFMGFLRNNEIPSAAQAIESADLSSLDEEVRESVMLIRGWLGRCKQLNYDLVCFYY